MRLSTLAALVLAAPLAHADLETLAPVRDGSLWDEPGGALASGAGPALFLGTSGNGQRRRAVIDFDVAGSIPAGSTITAVSLVVHCDQTPGGGVPNPVGLHRLLADWGEGASVSAGGGGAPSEVGDATWLHTSFASAFWAAAGGDFDPAASAVQPISAIGTVTWTDPALVADVQAMLDDPVLDHGWLLLADEALVGQGRRLVSREGIDPALRPRLEVEFTPPAGVPWPVATWVFLALVFVGVGVWNLRTRPGEPASI